ADGGITKSGDIVKALTLAHAVICGGLFAGCPEAPGQMMELGGKLYKQYRGMGSLAAMKAGSAARYGQPANGTQKVAPEGVEALKEVSPSTDRVLAQLIGGIQSGMGYLGAANLAQLREKARYIRVSRVNEGAFLATKNVVLTRLRLESLAAKFVVNSQGAQRRQPRDHIEEE